MRQFYTFRKSKLDVLNSQIVFFFESIYYQSHTTATNWDPIFIHKNLLPIYNDCPKLKRLLIEVHNRYIPLAAIEKNEIYTEVKNSKEIAAICNGSINIKHLDDYSEHIGKAIKKLYKYLYYQLPKTDAYKNIYGKLKNHYEKLKKINNKIKMCPFCGLLPINPLKTKKRQTYDHYLPLSLYPFAGIYTKNFVPTCKDCNSDYKHDKDILHFNSRRISQRKLFYPYGKYNYQLVIDINVHKLNNRSLKIENCDINILSNTANYLNEIKTWVDIYEIDTRYKNTIENDSGEWFEEFYDYEILKMNEGTFVNRASTFKEFLGSIKVQGSTSVSFLKEPYFQCIDNLTTVLK